MGRMIGPEEGCGHGFYVFLSSLGAGLFAFFAGITFQQTISLNIYPLDPCSRNIANSMGVYAMILAIVSLGFMIGAVVMSRCDKCRKGE